VNVTSLNKSFLQKGLWTQTEVGLVMFLASNLGNEPVSFNLRIEKFRPTIYPLLVLGAVVTAMADDGTKYHITFEGLGSVVLFFI
jgi:hypothetical protein